MLFLSVMTVTIFAFVLLFALVGLIYPTPLHKAVKLNSRGKNALACLASLIICMIAVVNAPSTSTENPQATNNTELENTGRPQNVGKWQDEIKKVAKSNKTKTEKYDEVMNLSKNYTPQPTELKTFEEYIKNEFVSGQYLKDIQNDEYMLANVFKADVVNRHYDDKLQLPIDEFAFDFWQNTKYTYRGVDTLESAAVKSNERQMNKALAKMK
jgi:hypothetical protein